MPKPESDAPLSPFPTHRTAVAASRIRFEEPEVQQPLSFAELKTVFAASYYVPRDEDKFLEEGRPLTLKQTALMEKLTPPSQDRPATPLTSDERNTFNQIIQGEEVAQWPSVEQTMDIFAIAKLSQKRGESAEQTATRITTVWQNPDIAPDMKVFLSRRETQQVRPTAPKEKFNWFGKPQSPTNTGFVRSGK